MVIIDFKKRVMELSRKKDLSIFFEIPLTERYPFILVTVEAVEVEQTKDGDGQGYISFTFHSHAKEEIEAANFLNSCFNYVRAGLYMFGDYETTFLEETGEGGESLSENIEEKNISLRLRYSKQ